MIIYPAIDLLNGSCVRLYKGQFDCATSYDVSPTDVALEYQKQGANWVHVVDLDGARSTLNRQSDLIKDIVSVEGIKVQTGGGVRAISDVEKLLDIGAARVVIGSLAVKEPDSVRDCFRSFGADKICLAIDVIPYAEQFQVAVSGWQENSGVYLSAVLEMYLDYGLRHVLCTDISRDGTLEGCNLGLYASLVTQYPSLDIQASGGVRGIEDIQELCKLNVGGVVIGKALYERKIDLVSAVKAASSC